MTGSTGLTGGTTADEGTGYEVLTLRHDSTDPGGLAGIGVVSATSRKLRVDAEAPVYDENRVPSGYFD